MSSIEHCDRTREVDLGGNEVEKVVRAIALINRTLCTNRFPSYF